ncbi:MAG: PAS domain S-box protein [Alphaproteobacteria bacterium]|nr:PAS domain S-box protein [Alphaproteobacteria bacterium]
MITTLGFLGRRVAARETADEIAGETRAARPRIPIDRTLFALLTTLIAAAWIATGLGHIEPALERLERGRGDIDETSAELDSLISIRMSEARQAVRQGQINWREQRLARERDIRGRIDALARDSMQPASPIALADLEIAQLGLAASEERGGALARAERFREAREVLQEPSYLERHRALVDAADRIVDERRTALGARTERERFRFDLFIAGSPVLVLGAVASWILALRRLWAWQTNVMQELSRIHSAELAVREHMSGQITTLFDALPVLIAYVDERMRYRLINRTYEQWFGIPRETLRGKRVEDVFGRDTWLRVAPHIEHALDEHSVRHDYLLEAPGSTRHIEATYEPHRDTDGEVQGVVIMAIVSPSTSSPKARCTRPSKAWSRRRGPSPIFSPR